MQATEQQIENYVKARKDAIVSSVKAMAAAVKTPGAADASGYAATGSMTVTAAVIYSRVNMVLLMDGQTLNFSGSGWGLGIGFSAAGAGAGYFNVSAQTLLNERSVNYQVTVYSGIAGASEITFYSQNNDFLGAFVAGGLGIEIGSFGGSGSFKS